MPRRCRRPHTARRRKMPRAGARGGGGRVIQRIGAGGDDAIGGDGGAFPGSENRPPRRNGSRRGAFLRSVRAVSGTPANCFWGRGSRRHDFFIGEGPGENEDLQGRPFVGRAGDLLNKMIAGMGLKREQVFIANIVKCRPPQNRTPAPDEVAACTPYLVRQLEIVRASHRHTGFTGHAIYAGQQPVDGKDARAVAELAWNPAHADISPGIFACVPTRRKIVRPSGAI